MKRDRDEKSQREASHLLFARALSVAHVDVAWRLYIYIYMYNRDDIRNKVRTIREEGSPMAEKGEERLVHAGYSKMAVEFRLT